MVRIAVAGATGLAGGLIHQYLTDLGHEVIPLARGHGIDLLSGTGLATALSGVHTVVDASNVRHASGEPREVMETAMSKLVSGARDAGVRRVVLLSINGIDDPGLAEFAYYAGKRAQESVLVRSGIEHLIVRSTQWFEFAMNPSVVAEHPDAVDVQDWLIQPVAVAAVARWIAESVSALGGGSRTVVLAGDERMRLPELTRRVLAARADPRLVRPVPPRFLAFATGALIPPPDATVIGPTLEQWLAARS